MVNGLAIVSPSTDPVYRVTRGLDLFAPPPWHIADPDDGTFGGRFDDPGKLSGLAEEQRFQVIYSASQRACAFAETIARMRPPLDVLAALGMVEQSTHYPSVSHVLTDPDEPARGVVTSEWRLRRRIGTAMLDRSLRFVDITSPRTMNHLRSVLAPVASSLGLHDVDLSAMTGQHRRFTQFCARYIYEQFDDADTPRFAGVRYLSRLNPGWECWAIFNDRLNHEVKTVESIQPHDPGLMEAAALFGLSIEGVQPGHYLRP